MSTAIYHNPEGHLPAKLDVLRTNPDGTVDLGRVVDDKPVLVIGKCRVSDKPTIGQCVLDSQSEQTQPELPPAKSPKGSKKSDPAAAGESPPQS